MAPTAPRSEWRPGHANKPEHLPHAGRGARAAPRLVYNTEISPHHSTLSTLLLTPGCPRGVRPIKAEVGQSSLDPISSHRGHSADVILAHNYEYMSSMSHPAIKVRQLGRPTDHGPYRPATVDRPTDRSAARPLLTRRLAVCMMRAAGLLRAAEALAARSRTVGPRRRRRRSA